jgi:thiamine pyrophosphokinase
VKALLVCAAPVEGTCRLTARLAAEADLVVAVDGGGLVCLEAGVVPDVVVGDFDSLCEADLARLAEQGATVVRFPADKDASDLDLAVDEARRRGATALQVTAASSGRLDHSLAVLGSLASAADLWPHLVEPDLDVWAVSPSGRGCLVLQGAGATVSLMSLSGVAVVSSQGLVWEVLDAELVAASSLGLSNRIGREGSARISVSSGVVLVFAPQVGGSVRAQGA